MMKKQNWIACVVLGCSMFYGCASLTSSDKMQEILSGQILEENVEQNVEQESQEEKNFDKFDIYGLKENIEIKEERKSGDTKIQYSLQNVQVYENPTEAGLKETDIVSADYYADEVKKRLTKEEIMGMKIIMCEVEIKSLTGGNERSIDEFNIVYETSEGELNGVGLPVFFSHHMEEPGDSKYYFYIASEESKCCKVAWAISEKIVENQNLYFSHGFYDDFNKHLIKIETNGG